MHIVNLFDISGLKQSDYGPRYNGAEKEIATLFGAKNVGFHLEVLNPGTFSCPYYYHEQEEEICVVLEGEAVLRENNVFRKLKAGDLVYFDVGPESAHHLYNHSDKAFKYLALSTRATEERCHYPDSHKTLDRKSRSILQDGVPVDYWKDEGDPSIHWPANALRGEVE